MTLLDLPVRNKHRAVKRREVRRNGMPAPIAWTRPRVRLTVDQYHEMIAKGILEEGIPIELLDGRLEWKDRSATGEDPMTVGEDHAWSLDALNELNPKLRRLGCYARIQLPVTLPPHDEPEPDVAIVRGTKDDYRDHHPGAREILCLIEVSDSSLTRDRTRKLRIYADGSIAVYVIVNLKDRMVEIHTQPLVGKGRFGQTTTLNIKQRVTFPTARGKGLTVPVRRLFMKAP